MRADAKLGHQDRAERHHDHEVEDVAELDSGEGEQEILFALRGKRCVHCTNFNRVRPNPWPVGDNPPSELTGVLHVRHLW